VSLALGAVLGVVAGLVAKALVGVAAGAAEGVAAEEGTAALAAEGDAEATGNAFLRNIEGCNSFAAGTAVLMADGSAKPIQDVKVGDKITNADPETTAPQQHTVTAVHDTDTDTDFASLSVATAAGPTTITVTAHHLFWDSTKHSWTTAVDLKLGDQLDTGGNGTATVLSSWRFTSSIRTYNLTVDGLHTYFVTAKRTPVLVHNDCGGAPSPGNIAVIGRRWDTKVARDWPGHDVLKIDDWTIDKNDEWIAAVIKNKQDVYVSSPLTRDNVWDAAANRETVMAREIRQLTDAGYTSDGFYLRAPAK
jgi:hypothetical protein